MEWLAYAFSSRSSGPRNWTGVPCNAGELSPAAADAKSLQLCLTLCDAVDFSLPGSPVPGILQVRTLEWAAISFTNAWKWKAKSECDVTQSCPILHKLMDCSLPGSSDHGIFQARVLEWGAIAFSRATRESPKFPRWILQWRWWISSKECAWRTMGRGL